MTKAPTSVEVAQIAALFLVADRISGQVHRLRMAQEQRDTDWDEMTFDEANAAAVYLLAAADNMMEGKTNPPLERAS